VKKSYATTREDWAEFTLYPAVPRKLYRRLRDNGELLAFVRHRHDGDNNVYFFAKRGKFHIGSTAIGQSFPFTLKHGSLFRSSEPDLQLSVAMLWVMGFTDEAVEAYGAERMLRSIRLGIDLTHLDAVDEYDIDSELLGSMAAGNEDDDERPW
jgi:hypothetical protein